MPRISGLSTVLTACAMATGCIGLHSPRPLMPSSLNTRTKTERPNTTLALTSVIFTEAPLSGCAGVEGVAEAVADEVDRQHRERDAQARRDPLPRILLQHGRRGGGAQHVAPTGRGRLHPQPQERQAG